jgi:hypothetical protein
MDLLCVKTEEYSRQIIEDIILQHHGLLLRGVGVKDPGRGAIEHCQARHDDPDAFPRVRRYFASPTPAAADVEINQRNLIKPLMNFSSCFSPLLLVQC